MRTKDFEAFIKKYVWDEEKTPYFVRVENLTRIQAANELFSYTFFMAFLFAAICVFSMTENAFHGRSYAVALYAFSVFAGACWFGATKHVRAAHYLALAPAVTLSYFVLAGFPPNLGTVDKWVLAGVGLALLRYSMRVVAIAKAFPNLPDPVRDG